ncbi:MAG: GerMN domain-containing protein [Actinomycetota bacterium]|nr:GerMN domain-containing protein [Actinomycetota bacterium]
MRAEVPTSIFLIDSNTEMLTEVLRPVPPPPSVRAGLLELLLGPTEEELARGLNSAITRSTTLLGVDGPRDGVVTVDLSDDLRSIGGQGQRLALAQVVFTATAAPEVSAVRFAFEGQPSAVPDGQGASTTEPLDRTDFATFDPRAPLAPPAASPPPSEAPPSSG